MKFSSKTNQLRRSSFDSDPLFSIIITLYSLILLYCPRLFLQLFFSPVLTLTAILLSTLLKLGSVKHQNQEKSPSAPQELENPNWVGSETDAKTETDTNLYRKPFFPDSLIEWNRVAPLEVIYEEYEGEEDEDSPEYSPEMEERRRHVAFYYDDESDTGSESDGECPEIGGWDLPENLCFRWEGEGEGLIEIPLERKEREIIFQLDEENLIEIDLTDRRFTGK